MFYELINNFQKGSDGWFLTLKVDLVWYVVKFWQILDWSSWCLKWLKTLLAEDPLCIHAKVCTVRNPLYDSIQNNCKHYQKHSHFRHKVTIQSRIFKQWILKARDWQNCFWVLMAERHCRLTFKGVEILEGIFKNVNKISVCYDNIGCGVFKWGIQNQKGFWLQINFSQMKIPNFYNCSNGELSKIGYHFRRYSDLRIDVIKKCQ